MTSSAHSASLKAAILTAIALALLVPLTLLSSLVAERVSQRDAAVQSVARGWGDRQWLAGPIIAIPVTIEGEHPRTCDWYVLPDRLDLVVELKVEEERRRLGVYEVPVYVAREHAVGEFDLNREIVRLTRDRKSTRLNSSHVEISYAVFCLKKKKTNNTQTASRPSAARQHADQPADGRPRPGASPARRLSLRCPPGLAPAPLTSTLPAPRVA